MNRASRIVAPALATVMLLSSSAPALAVTTPTIPTYAVEQADTATPNWPDWQPGPWWYGRPSVLYSYNKGYVKGVADGGEVKFAGSQEVTINQFATVMVRMCVSEADRAKFTKVDRERWVKHELLLESDVGGTRTQADFEALYDSGNAKRHWAALDMSIAQQAGLLDGLHNYGEGEEVCGRGQMAQMVANALALRGEDTSRIDVKKAVDYMSDSMAIRKSSYNEAIGIAIASGIISGVGGNQFNPDGKMDRASMCELFIRMDNPNGERAEVLKALTGSTSIPELPTDTTAPITIDMREYHDYTPEKNWAVLSPNAPTHREPREGDTVIKADGTSVVLTRTYGVLGFGQGVSPYIGTRCSPTAENGYGGTVFDGTFVIHEYSQGMQDPLALGVYLRCDVPGFENERHFTSEWFKIKSETAPKIEGKEGQIDSTGLWMFSSRYNSWCWQGPSCG